MEVHGGLAGLAGALAIDAVLADERQGVGEEVLGHGEAAALNAVLEFQFFEFFGSFFIDGGHRVMRYGER